jgi:hypothetical protein
MIATIGAAILAALFNNITPAQLRSRPGGHEKLRKKKWARGPFRSPPLSCIPTPARCASCANLDGNAYRARRTLPKEKATQGGLSIETLVAGVGFEPTTFGL